MGHTPRMGVLVPSPQNTMILDYVDDIKMTGKTSECAEYVGNIAKESRLGRLSMAA